MAHGDSPYDNLEILAEQKKAREPDSDAILATKCSAQEHCDFRGQCAVVTGMSPGSVYGRTMLRKGGVMFIQCHRANGTAKITFKDAAGGQKCESIW